MMPQNFTLDQTRRLLEGLCGGRGLYGDRLLPAGSLSPWHHGGEDEMGNKVESLLPGSYLDQGKGIKTWRTRMVRARRGRFTKSYGERGQIPTNTCETKEKGHCINTTANVLLRKHVQAGK